ncbi:MAG: hypothetical protein ACI4PH_02110 [Faecousia sp.]
MKYYRFPENRAAKLLFGAFLFAMLYLARDTLVTSSILGFNRAQYLMLGLIVLAGVTFLVYNRRELKAIIRDRRMMAVLAATVILLLPMAVKRDWQMMYFSILIGIYFAVFLSYFLSYREAAKYYVLILTGLGIYSVIALWVLRPLLVDTGIWMPPVFRNQLDIDFFHFGLSFVSNWYVSVRNFGIFREPGVYQYFLILALYLNNFAVEWKRERTLWLVNLALAVTMLTTLSTAGVAALALLAAAVFFEKKLYRSKWVWLGILAGAVVLAVIVAVIVAEQGELYWELYAMVLGKFQPGEDSAVERLDAVFADLDIFLRHPLVGDKLSQVLYSTANNTSSTLILYAGLGILGGTLNVAAWIVLVWDRKRSVLVNLMLLAALFLSFNTQNLIADVFFWLFPMMALTEWVLPRWKLGRTQKREP